MHTIIGQSTDGSLIRGSTCVKCKLDFVYRGAFRRTVCDGCRSMTAGAIKHRVHIESLTAGPVPDLGVGDGYKCLADPRPCAKTECRHHLDSHATCSIREANRGPMTLEEIASRIGPLTRE